MNRLTRLHILGGTLALVCILCNISKIIEAFKVDWQNGTSLLSTLAIGGYLLAFLINGLANFVFLMFKKWEHYLADGKRCFTKEGTLIFSLKSSFPSCKKILGHAKSHYLTACWSYDEFSPFWPWLWEGPIFSNWTRLSTFADAVRIRSNESKKWHLISWKGCRVNPTGKIAILKN